MGALVASDITITILQQWISRGKRFVVGTLQIAATNTYTDNGITLPVIAKFGMWRQLDVLDIFGVDPTRGTVADYHDRYDKTNHKLFLFEEEAAAAGGPLLECDTAEAPGLRIYDFLAVGW